jgi:CRISPR/Cas system CSM-associated protein Csm3 (group 7 of RAMP superfamily)
LRVLIERLADVGSRCRLYQEGPSRRGADTACECPVCALLGDVRPVAPEARASRVEFLEAVIKGADERVVDSVSIDRARRAAAEGRKLDMAEVVPGARLRIEIRGRDLSSEELDWLGAALRLVGTGAWPIGGLTSRGRGRLRAISAGVWQRDLADPRHLIAAVIHGSDADEGWPERTCDALAGLPGARLRLRDRVEIRMDLATAPESTFLVADPAEAFRTGFDRAPRGGAETPELPASSLKGCLRSGAERVLRTLQPGAACDPTGEASCARLTQRQKNDRGKVHRCPTCTLFGNEGWASRLSIQVERASTAPAQAQPFDHVAIDRFTGGARASLKLDTLASRDACFNVTLTLDTAGLKDERDWMLGLLLLTLADLGDGHLHVGHGSARGHGRLELISGPEWPAEVDPQRCVAAVWSLLGIAQPGQREAAT